MSIVIAVALSFVLIALAAKRARGPSEELRREQKEIVEENLRLGKQPQGNPLYWQRQWSRIKVAETREKEEPPS